MKVVSNEVARTLTPEEARVLSAWGRMAMADRTAAMNFIESSAKQIPEALTLRLVKGGRDGKAN